MLFFLWEESVVYIYLLGPLLDLMDGKGAMVLPALTMPPETRESLSGSEQGDVMTQVRDHLWLSL